MFAKIEFNSNVSLAQRLLHRNKLLNVQRLATEGTGHSLISLDMFYLHRAILELEEAINMKGEKIITVEPGENLESFSAIEQVLFSHYTTRKSGDYPDTMGNSLVDAITSYLKGIKGNIKLASLTLFFSNNRNEFDENCKFILKVVDCGLEVNLEMLLKFLCSEVSLEDSQRLRTLITSDPIKYLPLFPFLNEANQDNAYYFSWTIFELFTNKFLPYVESKTLGTQLEQVYRSLPGRAMSNWIKIKDILQGKDRSISDKFFENIDYLISLETDPFLIEMSKINNASYNSFGFTPVTVENLVEALLASAALPYRSAGSQSKIQKIMPLFFGKDIVATQIFKKYNPENIAFLQQFHFSKYATTWLDFLIKHGLNKNLFTYERHAYRASGKRNNNSLLLILTLGNDENSINQFIDLYQQSLAGEESSQLKFDVFMDCILLCRSKEFIPYLLYQVKTFERFEDAALRKTLFSAIMQLENDISIKMWRDSYYNFYASNDPFEVVKIVVDGIHKTKEGRAIPSNSFFHGKPQKFCWIVEEKSSAIFFLQDIIVLLKQGIDFLCIVHENNPKIAYDKISAMSKAVTFKAYLTPVKDESIFAFSQEKFDFFNFMNQELVKNLMSKKESELSCGIGRDEFLAVYIEFLESNKNDEPAERARFKTCLQTVDYLLPQSLPKISIVELLRWFREKKSLLEFINVQVKKLYKDAVFFEKIEIVQRLAAIAYENILISNSNDTSNERYNFFHHVNFIRIKNQLPLLVEPERTSSETGVEFYVPDETRFLTNSDFKLLLGYLDYKYNKALTVLGKANMLTLRNIDLFNPQVVSVTYVENIGKGFEVLQRGSIFSQENIDLLVAHAQYACEMSEGLVCLKKAGIFSQDNVNLLIAHAQYAYSLGAGLAALKEADIFSHDNINLLIAHNQYASPLGAGFAALKKADIFSENYINLLVMHANCAHSLGVGFTVLKKADIFSHDNINLLIAHAKHAQSFAFGLVSLQQAGILFQNNIKLLGEQAEYAYKLDAGFKILQEANILNQESINLLIADTRNAELLGRLAIILQKMDMLSPTNVKLLLLTARAKGDANWLYNIFSVLQQANILTQNNFELIVKNLNHPYHCVDGLEVLQRAGICTQDNFELLLAYAGYHKELAQGLVALHKAKIFNEGNVKLLVFMHAKMGFGRFGESLKELQEAGILTQYNFELLSEHEYRANRWWLTSVLVALQKAGLLSTDNVNLLITHKMAYVLHNMLKPLQQAGILTQANYQMLFQYIDGTSFSHDEFEILQKNDILTQPNFTLIISHVGAKGIDTALKMLQNGGMVTQANFELLITNAMHAERVGVGLEALGRVSILTQSNFELLIANAMYAGRIGIGLEALQGASIFTQANYALLMQVMSNIEFNSGLVALQGAGILSQTSYELLILAAKNINSAYLFCILKELRRIGILTRGKFNLLIAHMQYIEEIAIGLGLVKPYENDCPVTPANFNLLITHSQYARKLGAGLASLHKAGILTLDNINLLLANAQHSVELGEGVAALQRSGLLVQENINLLIAQMQYANNLGEGFATLKMANIFVQNNINLLIAHAKHAKWIGKVLVALHQAALFTPSNLNLLLARALTGAWSEAAINYGIGDGLAALQAANILTQANFELLISRWQDALQFGQGFIILAKAKVLTQYKFERLIAHLQYGKELWYGFELLSQVRILWRTDLFELLIVHAQYAHGLGAGLTALYNRRLAELSEENLKIMVDRWQYASGLGIIFLGLTNADIFTRGNIENLLEYINLIMASDPDNRIIYGAATQNFSLKNEQQAVFALQIAVSILQTCKKLTQALFEEMLEHPDEALLIAYENWKTPGTHEDMVAKTFVALRNTVRNLWLIQGQSSTQGQELFPVNLITKICSYAVPNIDLLDTRTRDTTILFAYRKPITPRELREQNMTQKQYRRAVLKGNL